MIGERDQKLGEQHHENAGNDENNNVGDDRLIHILQLHARRGHAQQIEHVDAEGRGNHAQAEGDAQGQDRGVEVQRGGPDDRQQDGD